MLTMYPSKDHQSTESMMKLSLPWLSKMRCEIKPPNRSESSCKPRVPMLSCCINSGTLEPTYANIVILPNTMIHDNQMTLSAACHNCSRWQSGFLDMSSPAPWMHAFGPVGNPTNSHALQAVLTYYDSCGIIHLPCKYDGVWTLGLNLITREMVKVSRMMSSSHNPLLGHGCPWL